MTNPKGYIIHLKNHQKSVEWSNHALTTGQKFGWKLELYDGVDGTKEKLEDYKVKIYPHNKKCVRLLSRPGTQGCFLSQYKLWKKCFQRQTQPKQDSAVLDLEILLEVMDLLYPYG